MENSQPIKKKGAYETPCNKPIIARNKNTIDQKVRARPSSIGGDGEGLLVGEPVSQFSDKVGGSEGRSSRWDPEGGAGNEGKPIRGGLLDEDPLNDVVELL